MIKGLVEVGVISDKQLANRCFKQGQQFIKQGQKGLGGAALWLAVKHDPDLAGGHLSLAKLYLDLRRFGPAFYHAQMATDLGIQEGRAVTGRLYQQIAVALHSSDATEGLQLLAECEENIERRDSLEETALWACERAEHYLLEAGEPAVRAWIVHAELLQKRDPSKAWDLAYQACRAGNNPDHYPLLASLTSRHVLLLQEEGQHEEAIKVCQRVQTLMPENGAVKMAVLDAQVLCYWARGMHAKATHFAWKIWQTRGAEKDGRTLLNCALKGAQQRQKASRYEEAHHLLMIAEEVTPDDAELVRHQVVLFEKWGEHGIEQGSEIKGKSRHDLKRWGHVRRGLADDLRAQLRGPPPRDTTGAWSDQLDQAARSVKLSPTDPQALEHYAQVYRSLGERLVEGEVPDELMWEIVPYIGEFFDPMFAGVYAFEEAERILPAEDNQNALSKLDCERAWSLAVSAFQRKPQSSLRREWLKRNGVAYARQLLGAEDRQGARGVLLQAGELCPEDESLEQMGQSLGIERQTPIPDRTRAILT